MRIIACMPAYKIMDVLAVRSLVAFQAEIYSRGDKLTIVFTNGYTASMGRNTMFRYAAEEEYDYVVSLDSDHVYEAQKMYDLIEKMEANNLKMLSAKYWARSDFRLNNRTVAMGTFDKDKKFSLHIPPEDETGIIDMDVVGLGFCVMKWDFVKMLTEKHENLFHVNKEGHYADDVVFCSFVKDEGERVCYDADTKIGHISTMINI